LAKAETLVCPLWSESDQILRRSEMTLCAKTGLIHCKKTASLFANF
jgi:hypothetical protein